jgi:AcrR family transcriptional regulator
VPKLAVPKIVASTGSPDDRRATRWSQHKTDRRAHILDAAVAAIEQYGPDVGVQQIAEEAQLTRAVVYRLFDDRGDLEQQIRTRVAATFLTELAPALTLDGSIATLIEQNVHTYLTWTIEHPNLHQFVGSRSRHIPPTGASVAVGAKTALAVQLSQLLVTLVRGLGHDTATTESRGVGRGGLSDWAGNRWRTDPQPALSSTALEALLCRWAWQLIDSTLQAEFGIELDPDVPIAELIAPAR